MNGCALGLALMERLRRLGNGPFVTPWLYISAQIHALVDSRADVLTLDDQIVRAARFSRKFYIAMAEKRPEPGRLYVVFGLN